MGSLPMFTSEGGKTISGAAKVWKVGLAASHEDWPGRESLCRAYLSEPMRSSTFPAQFASCLVGCCQHQPDVPACQLFVELRCYLGKVCCGGWR